MIVYTASSPETGWAPFIQWLQEQGINPYRVRRLTLYPRIMQANVIEKAKGRPGVTFRVVGYTSDPPRLAGDCEQDCQERCAYPGIDSACEIDQ